MAALARRAAERALAELAGRALRLALDLAVLAGESEWVARELAARGIRSPRAEDILDVLEERADSIDLDAALERADSRIRLLVEGLLAAASRLARREWIERLTYEEALRLAGERGDARLREILLRWPRLSRAILDWARVRMLAAQR